MYYILTRNMNTFTILKVGVGNLFVTVAKQSNCQLNQYEVLFPEQQVLVSTTITLPNVDGLYEIFITNKANLTESKLVSMHTQFIASLVEDVRDILCGCKCDTCKDCGRKEVDYLSLLVKLFSYNIINGGMYNQFLTATNNCVKCEILDINQCLLLHKTILGNYDNTNLMKQIIAYYYLVYYFTDLKLNLGSVNVTAQYDYTNIVKCIRRLGLNEDCINNAIVIVQPQGIFTTEFNNTFV